MAGEVARNHAVACCIVGVLEIVFGLIIIICSFVLGGMIHLSASLTPYWAGIPYIIPGILGIVTGVTKNYGAVIAFLILNIICCIIDGIATLLLSIVLAFYAAAATAVTNPTRNTNCTSYPKYGLCSCKVDGGSRSFSGLGKDGCEALPAVISLFWAILIFAILSGIITFIGSILGCIVVCCSPRQKEPSLIVLQTGQPGTQQNQGYQEQLGYQAQPGYPAQPGYQAQPGYHAQPGYPAAGYQA